MKKLLSIVLSLALALSLSVSAFAAGEDDTGDTGTGTTPQNTTINYGDTNQAGNTTVNYSVNPAYTVTIPASVTIGNSVTVKAEGVTVEKGKQVVVKLTGINVTSENATGDTDFKVTTDEGAALKYTVKKGQTEITTDETNNTVLTVDPSTTTANAVASGSTDLTFALATGEVVQYAGNYTGTVTFTVSVEEVTTTTTP